MSARRKHSRLAASRAIWAAEARATGRSRQVYYVLFLIPVFVMGFVGFAMRGYTTPELVVGVFVEGAGGRVASSGDRVERLIGILEADPHLHVRRYDDPDRMRVAVFRGRLQGGLRIPADWQAGQDVPYWAARAGAGAPTLRALLDRAIARLDRPQMASARVEVVDGAQLGDPPIGYTYTAPSNLVLFVFLNAVLGALRVVGLRRSGLGRRMIASPASPAEISVALTLAPLRMMTLQALFLIAIGGLAFGIDWGDAIGVALMTGAMILCGTGLQLAIGTLFTSEPQLETVGPFLGILLGMLGGCLWPLQIVPDSVADFGHLFPTAWAMDGYLALIFGGVGWREILTEAAVVAGMGIGLLGLGTWRLRRSLSPT